MGAGTEGADRTVGPVSLIICNYDVNGCIFSQSGSAFLADSPLTWSRTLAEAGRVSWSLSQHFTIKFQSMFALFASIEWKLVGRSGIPCLDITPYTDWSTLLWNGTLPVIASCIADELS
jgi:hypothetical protein